MNQVYKLDRPQDITQVGTYLRGLDYEKPWQVEIKPYKKDRTNAQNRLLYLWLSQIEAQNKHGEQNNRNFCKFTYGCPILARDNESFAEFYGSLMENYEYEQCIKSMEFIAVTSLMNTKQFTEYLNQIEQYANEQGYRLTRPDDLYFQAMGK